MEAVNAFNQEVRAGGRAAKRGPRRGGGTHGGRHRVPQLPALPAGPGPAACGLRGERRPGAAAGRRALFRGKMEASAAGPFSGRSARPRAGRACAGGGAERSFGPPRRAPASRCCPPFAPGSAGELSPVGSGSQAGSLSRGAPGPVCWCSGLGKPRFGTRASRQWLGERAAVRGGGTGRGRAGRGLIPLWERRLGWDSGVDPSVAPRTGWKAFTHLSYRTEGPSLFFSVLFFCLFACFFGFFFVGFKFFLYYYFLVSRKKLEVKRTMVVFCII